jgi:hypothetical protein
MYSPVWYPVVAAVASDLVLDTGDMAIECGHTGGVYMADYIPHQNPRNRRSVALWIEGFATIFKIIHNMFKAGDIPTISNLEGALAKLPKDERKLIEAYEKQDAEVESVLEALTSEAKLQWEEDDFEATHCGEDWDELPECPKHDFNWSLAREMLVG